MLVFFLTYRNAAINYSFKVVNILILNTLDNNYQLLLYIYYVTSSYQSLFFPIRIFAQSLQPKMIHKFTRTQIGRQCRERCYRNKIWNSLCQKKNIGGKLYRKSTEKRLNFRSLPQYANRNHYYWLLYNIKYIYGKKLQQALYFL